MKKTVLFIAMLLLLNVVCFAASSVYKYNFPKPSKTWGRPVSFNNLSPGFFQVMFQAPNGTVRIATYGIAGGTMDTLKDPQLMMVFTFDQDKVGMLQSQ